MMYFIQVHTAIYNVSTFSVPKCLINPTDAECLRSRGAIIYAT